MTYLFNQAQKDRMYMICSGSRFNQFGCSKDKVAKHVAKDWQRLVHFFIESVVFCLAVSAAVAMWAFIIFVVFAFGA